MNEQSNQAQHRQAASFTSIYGETCPSCCRENSFYGNLCTSDDCDGFNALTKAEAARALELSEAAFQEDKAAQLKRCQKAALSQVTQ